MSEANSASSGGVKKTSLMVAVAPLLILFACAVILYGLSADGAEGALGYWETFVWVVAVVSILYGWTQSVGNRYAIPLFSLIGQLLIWGALYLVFKMVGDQGLLTGLDATKQGILLIYLLGFTTLIVSLTLCRTLLFFALFVVFCGYLIAVPTNNPTLIAVGDYFGIANAASKPFMMTVGMATVGFVASLLMLLNVRGAAMAHRAAKSG